MWSAAPANADRNGVTSLGSHPQRIGLLGGSFNPAHGGHLHISREALDRLALDEVWWLVSPQNPLKPAEGMAALPMRISHARKVAEGAPITVTDMERRFGTRYTAHTLAALKDRFPDKRFVWLMGSDNLIGIHRWKAWRSIFRSVPIAVFHRPTYSLRALRGRAAARFSKARLPASRARELADRKPPAWVFLRIRPHPASATEMRARNGGSGN